ncbi:hypothetical protein GW17_00027518 [Ensete ventricosum]|nr:hypothetical protein GW17_00027518 [Ensete ventricosum]
MILVSLFTPLLLISFQGTFLLATWRGIEVAVKMFGEDVMTDEDKVWVGPILSTELYVCSNYNVFLVSAFMDELALLQKIRHPNVVQFLGAVTQSSPMMIVTEYLPKVIS